MEFSPNQSDQDENSIPVTVNSGSTNGPGGAPVVRDSMLSTPSSDSTSTTTPAPSSQLNDTPQSEPGAASTTSQDHPASENSVPPATPPKTKHPRPKGAVIAAIVIFLLLAGLSVFAYMKTKNKTESVADKPAATTPAVQSAVTPQDVDKTNEELDKSLNNASDASDINQTDLSDRALGL